MDRRFKPVFLANKKRFGLFVALHAAHLPVKL